MKLILYLAFGLMSIINEPLHVSLWNMSWI